MSLVYSDETGSIEFDQLSKHKENIQPVNSGRTVSQLTQIVDLATNKSVLSIVSTNSTSPNSITGTSAQRRIKNRIEDSHAHYEEQLNNYKDNDILSIWIEYIEELQTSTYSSSSRSIVSPTIEACINHLCTNGHYLTQYKNDPRFIKYCFQLCEFVDDPLRIYRFLQAKEIAQKDAKFFLNYSTILYLREHYKSAMEVLYTAIKSKVEPIAHLKNRYKYLILCEKQRISKLLGEEIDDKKLQELFKSKDPQTIGKLYHFSYDATRDNILLEHNTSNPQTPHDSQNPSTKTVLRGLSVVYKEEFQNGQEITQNQPQLHQPSIITQSRSPTVPKVSPTVINSSTGIFCDDSDDDNVTDQKAVQLMSPQIKKHSVLATSRNRSKENVQPYTGDFAYTYDTEYLETLDQYNMSKGICSLPVGIVPAELPKSHITSGIYCDDDE